MSLYIRGDLEEFYYLLTFTFWLEQASIDHGTICGEMVFMFGRSRQSFFIMATNCANARCSSDIYPLYGACPVKIFFFSFSFKEHCYSLRDSEKKKSVATMMESPCIYRLSLFDIERTSQFSSIPDGFHRSKCQSSTSVRLFQSIYIYIYIHVYIRTI
ncbi:hypothetical protein VTN77DRAFT_3231 [Rasamsonia byssochlamydoides]|uniref:uncharacterized protein n=1 Tax=Rasamsonia byssochlamydoides TaxID=89139 RepID=UPI0037420884